METNVHTTLQENVGVKPVWWAKIAHLAKMDITGLEMMLPVDAKVSLFDFKFPKMFNTWYFFIFRLQVSV